MVDARQILKPKFTFSRLDDMIVLRRDNGIVLKM